MSRPVKHHYLPNFYLKRWAGENGEVLRFRRSHGNEVKGKPVSPNGTGYKPHLYSMRMPDGPPNPVMEEVFMEPLDDKAAKAIDLLEQRLPESKWEPRDRTAWSRFIWSLLIRTPSDIDQLKSLVKEPSEKITPGLKEAYEKIRSEGAQDNVDEYLGNIDPHEVDRIIRFLPQFIDNPRIGGFINKMFWKVLNVESTGIPLITSDRPVWMKPTFAEPDPAIVVPIGPTNLFVATQDISTMRHIEKQSCRQLVKLINRTSVQHAIEFVYVKGSTIDPKMKAFVQKHFATHRQSTPMERIAEKYGQRIVAEDSPLNSHNSELED